MGINFVEFPDGPSDSIYICSTCDTPLVNVGRTRSTRFRSNSGTAILFDGRICNVTHG